MKSPAEIFAERYAQERCHLMKQGTIALERAILDTFNFVLAFAEEHHSDIRSADWLIEKLKSLKETKT